MKKLFAILITLLIAFAICSCGNNDKYNDDKTVVLKNTSDNKNITIKFEHKGDDITKLSQKEIISFDSLGVSNAMDAQALLEPKIAMIPTIDGYENKITVKDDHVEETIDINFQDIDVDKINEIPGLNFVGDANEQISLEETIKELKKSGFKEVDEKK